MTKFHPDRISRHKYLTNLVRQQQGDYLHTGAFKIVRLLTPPMKVPLERIWKAGANRFDQKLATTMCMVPWLAVDICTTLARGWC